MSIETRMAVASHPHLFFQAESQRSDLLNPHTTKTQLIAFLQHMLLQGWIIELTCVCSDHRPDGYLNPNDPHCGTHQYGWSIDCWPLTEPTPGKWMDATDPHFQKFLSSAIHAPFYYQTGLGGNADSAINRVAAGPNWFPDSSEDHVHFGTKQ